MRIPALQDLAMQRSPAARSCERHAGAKVCKYDGGTVPIIGVKPCPLSLD